MDHGTRMFMVYLSVIIAIIALALGAAASSYGGDNPYVKDAVVADAKQNNGICDKILVPGNHYDLGEHTEARFIEWKYTSAVWWIVYATNDERRGDKSYTYSMPHKDFCKVAVPSKPFKLEEKIEVGTLGE